MFSINFEKRKLSDQQAIDLINIMLTPIYRRLEDEVYAGRLTYADYDEILDRIYSSLNSKHSELADKILR